MYYCMENFDSRLRMSWSFCIRGAGCQNWEMEECLQVSAAEYERHCTSLQVPLLQNTQTGAYTTEIHVHTVRESIKSEEKGLANSVSPETYVLCLQADGCLLAMSSCDLSSFFTHPCHLLLVRVPALWDKGHSPI